MADASTWYRNNLLCSAASRVKPREMIPFMVIGATAGLSVYGLDKSVIQLVQELAVSQCNSAFKRVSNKKNQSS